MSTFLDTSALIKYFSEELGAEEVSGLVESEVPIWISELTAIEGVSALAKKARNHEISVEECRKLIGQFTQFLDSGRCDLILLDDTIKERARTMLGAWALTHRLDSLDALQLAAAIEARESADRMEFYTADQQLLAAAQAHGFTVRNPGVT